jgi:hypothetical protein
VTSDLANLDAATDLGKYGKSKDGDGHRNLFVTREGSRNDNIHHLALNVEDREAILEKQGTWMRAAHVLCYRFHIIHSQIRTWGRSK